MPVEKILTSMSPCLYIEYGYDSMDLDMGPYPHIITHMDMDIVPWIWM